MENIKILLNGIIFEVDFTEKPIHMAATSLIQDIESLDKKYCSAI